MAIYLGHTSCRSKRNSSEKPTNWFRHNIALQTYLCLVHFTITIIIIIAIAIAIAINIVVCRRRRLLQRCTEISEMVDFLYNNNTKTQHTNAHF